MKLNPFKLIAIIMALVLLTAPVSFVFNHQIHPLARYKSKIEVGMRAENAKRLMADYCRTRSASLEECSLQFETLLVTEFCWFKVCSLSVDTEDFAVTKIRYRVE